MDPSYQIERDANILEKLNAAMERMNYAMTAYTNCTVNMEAMKKNVRALMENDEKTFQKQLEKFDYQENVGRIENKCVKQFSKIIKLFEKDGLSELFEKAGRNEECIETLDEFESKVRTMSSQLKDFEEVKTTANKMMQKVDNHSELIDIMSDQGDDYTCRYSITFACSALTRNMDQTDRLFPIFVLPSVLASLAHQKSTSDYYRGIIDKLNKRVLALVELVEKERNPTATFSVSSSNLSSKSGNAKSLEKTAVSSSGVSIQPQPEGVTLNHGEVTAPKLINVLTAKDSQITGTIIQSPLPALLPNGEAVQPSSPTTKKVGPIDSITRMPPDVSVKSEKKSGKSRSKK